MTKLILGLSLLFSVSAFAAEEPNCLGILQKYYRESAKASPDWGYEDFYALKKADAIEMITYAGSSDYSDEQRETFNELIRLRQNRTFMLGWNAPGNQGQSIIIANRMTCEVLQEIVVSSEE